MEIEFKKKKKKIREKETKVEQFNQKLKNIITNSYINTC